jgi:hypothetical protein
VYSSPEATVLEQTDDTRLPACSWLRAISRLVARVRLISNIELVLSGLWIGFGRSPLVYQPKRVKGRSGRMLVISCFVARLHGYSPWCPDTSFNGAFHMGMGEVDGQGKIRGVG